MGHSEVQFIAGSRADVEDSNVWSVIGVTIPVSWFLNKLFISGTQLTLSVCLSVCLFVSAFIVMCTSITDCYIAVQKIDSVLIVLICRVGHSNFELINHDVVEPIWIEGE